MSDSMRRVNARDPAPPPATPAGRVQRMRSLVAAKELQLARERREGAASLESRTAGAMDLARLLGGLEGLPVRPHHYVHVTWANYDLLMVAVKVNALPGEKFEGEPLDNIATIEVHFDPATRRAWYEMDGQRVTPEVVLDLVLALVEARFDLSVLEVTGDPIPF